MNEAWSSFYYQHHHLELENLLKQHEAIVDAGVIGIPDIVQREVCHAYLCLQAGYSLTEELKDELCKIIAKEYALDCIPNEFIVVEQMPKTRSGKLSRQLLKSWAIDNLKKVF